MMTSSRMELVDSLRGFALMGLFLVHCVELFELYWLHPTEGAVQAWVFGLFAGKSFALFALCFGLSFHILMDRAARRGVDFSRRFAWRLSLLFVFGLVHGVIYRGDVLVILGLFGLPLILFNRIRSNRALIALAIIFLLQPALLVRAAAAVAGAAWANHPALFYDDPGLKTLATGGFADAIAVNATAGQVGKWSYYVETGRLSQVVGLYLLGLVLGRAGFFAEPDRFKRGRRLGLAVAAALHVVLTFAKAPILAALPHSAAPDLAQQNFAWMIEGWTALALLAVQVLVFIDLYQGVGRPLLSPLSAAGRMTLTLYVGQSLVFTPLFYGYGLGLYARLTEAQALGLGVVAYVLQIAAAHLWFRSFQYGPLEWLWRALTYLSLDVPFRRKPA